MERKGKKLAQLPDGHPRRMADARNAWRKMTMEQRVGFLEWIEAEHGKEDGAYLPPGWSIVDPGRHWTTGEYPSDEDRAWRFAQERELT